ncbi:MAG: zinc-ribbon domain-containing protein [Candidatus Cloacimonadaceae bacterium]
MNCPKCNAEISAGSKFCGACGFQISQDKACQACGHKNEPGTRFCENCGTSMDGSQQPRSRTQPQQQTHSNVYEEEQTRKKRIYPNKANRLKDTVAYVNRLLKTEKLETQVINNNNFVILQGRKPPTWLKTTLGMDVAVSISFKKSGNDLIVEIGGAKWMDKAAGTAIGLFVFWPVLLTAGWGLYMQNVLFEKIDNAVITYLQR